METYLKTLTVQAPLVQMPTLQAQAVNLQERDYKIELGSLLSLKGKTTLITGGARGIGLALARGVAELGGDVAILDTLQEPHEDFYELDKVFRVKARYYRADVTQKKSLEGAFAQVVAEFGHVDGCVIAAGMLVSGQFLEHKWEDTIQVQMVNVVGAFFSAQLAAKQMRSQGNGGSIVMIASVAAYRSDSRMNISAYAASKGAVKSLGHALATELGPYGIRVNTISPGYIMTAMTQDALAENQDLATLFQNSPPLGRIGQPSELKGAVAFLLSDAASYVTGSDLPITGGVHVGI